MKATASLIVPLLVCGSAAFATDVQPKAGAPLVGLTQAELDLFNAGKARFLTALTVDLGLGPIFNKAACSACHANPLGGWGTITVTRFGVNTDGVFTLYPGEEQSLFQVTAISESCQEILPADAYTALRVTNSSMAFGLIEAIPDAAIAANEDPNDANADGISGRVNWVHTLEDPTGPLRAGRFGWKAQVATVLTFSGDASRNEMGLTNRLVPTEAAPNGNHTLLAQCDTVSDPEDIVDGDGYAFIDHVTHFQRYLGPPPQTPKSGMSGEVVFNQIGCAKCHIPQWTTSNDPSLEDAIRNKTIRPYSDFLLHDMGLLGDGIAQDGGAELEMRTPTLWNLRTRDPMLHNASVSGDTFANRVTLAIEAHGPFGEGAGSAANFAALSQGDKDKLVAFLNSLGRREFDDDGDGVVDYNDFYGFELCFGMTVTPDDPCAVHDINQDGVVDMTDFDLFLTVYEGVQGDCNLNGQNDLKDILLGISQDNDFNGIPDECACLGNLNGDSVVDGADLGILLGHWGTTGPIGDINHDGIVNGADLGALLGHWGPCP